MSRLLMYIGEGVSFDEVLVKDFWRNTKGVSGLRENAMVGAVLSGHFQYEDDSTLFELKSDRETIALSGTGKASIQMCFMLQSISPSPLHVIDEDYSFDFMIQDYRTANELADAIYSAIGRT